MSLSLVPCNIVASFVTEQKHREEVVRNDANDRSLRFVQWFNPRPNGDGQSDERRLSSTSSFSSTSPMSQPNPSLYRQEKRGQTRRPTPIQTRQKDEHRYRMPLGIAPSSRLDEPILYDGGNGRSKNPLGARVVTLERLRETWEHLDDGNENTKENGLRVVHCYDPSGFELVKGTV